MKNPKRTIIILVFIIIILAIALGISIIFNITNKNGEANTNTNTIENITDNSTITEEHNNQNIVNEANQNAVKENDSKKNNTVNETVNNKISQTNSNNTITNTVNEPAKQNTTNTVKEPVNQNTSSKGKVIAIDPGHQTKGNSQKEPIGPGATETKAKVTGGATGVATGQTEYSLNLKVSLKLKTALEAKGYTVIMTRTTNDVNMSNSERAKIANNANADAFIRIHGNSSTSSSAKGVLTMCQTAQNKYNGNLADESYSLSKCVLDGVINKIGAVNRGVTRTDTMSGINWCTVPTTILEMGFMSNAEEDKLLADDSYQDKIVAGIVAGLDNYFSK